jgi:hypothetical protein
MDDHELRELLEHIHGEIDQIKTIDGKDRDLLRDLNTDIRELLERSEDKRTQSHPSVVQRLESSIDLLEATNPTVTVLLNKLLEILSNAGI